MQRRSLRPSAKLRSLTKATAPADVSSPPLGAPFLWDTQAEIGVYGDGCLGARIEAAYDSGTARAGAALAQGSP